MQLRAETSHTFMHLSFDKEKMRLPVLVMTSAQIVDRCPDKIAFAFLGLNGFQTRITQSGPPVTSIRVSEKIIVLKSDLIYIKISVSAITKRKDTIAERETGYSHANLKFILHLCPTHIENAQRTIRALATRHKCT